MENRWRLPPLGAGEQDLLDYRDRWFNYLSTVRCRDMERHARNIHYTTGRQWIEPDLELNIEPNRSYVWRDIKSQGQEQQPRPVSNYIGVAVEVEQTSLASREVTPTVIPNSRDPHIQAAAHAAKRILEDRMRKVDWNEKRELATFLYVVTGTVILKSYWDETYTDLSTVPSPDAMQCDACGAAVASPKVASNQVKAVPVVSNVLKDVSAAEDEDQTFELQGCPGCAAPLRSKTADEYPEGLDLMQAPDYFGRPMGVNVPKGNTQIEVISPFDFFPENSGIDVGALDTRVWGQATPRPIEWIEERYPHLVGKLEPENATWDILRHHPFLADWNTYGSYDHALDSNVYDHHVRLYEITADRTMAFPNGRRIVLAGDEVAEDGELYRTVTTQEGSESVPVVKYAFANFKPRHKMFWGEALVDNLISPQNQLNGMKALLIESLVRMGGPNLLVPEDANLSAPVWFEQYGLGKILRYSPSGVVPTAKPEVFGGVEPPQGMKDLITQAIEDIRSIAGPQPIEIGDAPKNITTTSGLQLLGESAARRRGPRERSLIEAFQRIWEHQLKLLWVLRWDQDSYGAETEDGYEEVEYTRHAIKGCTKVKVEKQAYLDRSIYNREGVREAQADGLVFPNNQAAIKKILEYRGLPTDINEELNYQVDRSIKQWLDFKDESRQPVIDESLDDPKIHWEVLAKYVLSDEGRQLEDTVEWPKILELIAGWEQELAVAEMLDAQTLAFYGGVKPSPEQGVVMYAQAKLNYQTQMTIWKLTTDAMGEAVASGGVDPMAAAPPPPPKEPPPPVFLPPGKDKRVYMIWMKLIQQNAKQMLGQPDLTNPAVDVTQQPQLLSPEQDKYLRFRAVVDAYKLLAKAKAEVEAMAMAQPLPPAGVPLAGPAGVGATPPPPNPQNPPSPAANPGGV